MVLIFRLLYVLSFLRSAASSLGACKRSLVFRYHNSFCSRAAQGPESHRETGDRSVAEATASQTQLCTSSATGQPLVPAWTLEDSVCCGHTDICASWRCMSLFSQGEARLDFKYRAMETIGWMAESSLTGGLCCKDIQPISH